jgi:fumarate reductase subunit C
VYLLLFVRAVSRGDSTYQEFLAWSRHPVVMVLNVVTLLFVVFHAVTWFNLAPKAMVVHVGHKRLPGSLISASNYAAWVVATALVVWALVGG